MYVLKVYSHGQGYDLNVPQSNDKKKLEEYARKKQRNQRRRKRELVDHEFDWDCWSIDYVRSCEEI